MTTVADAEQSSGVPRAQWVFDTELTEFVPGVSAVVVGTNSLPDGSPVPGFNSEPQSWYYQDGQWWSGTPC